MNQTWSYIFWSVVFLVLGVPLGLCIKALFRRRQP